MICFEEWFSRWPCIVLCIALSFMNLTALEAKSDIRWMPQAGFYRVVKHFNVGTIRIKSLLTIHFCCRSIRDSFEEKIKLLHLFFGSAWLITENELQTQSYPDVCICSGACFSKVPKLFGRHNSLCIFKTKASRGTRSEERRVGKECRSRWSPYH